ncbi:Methyltransferase domain-containing protein [Eubacterium uniforme]|uniref:Methyltransferase domain-containing protein n=1 Tax=Eubacterium uniforme TaxID=39495 RepID=A0A1T4V7U2_9FIRM|nr:class I SAM-dependent methyltransferase [Eubacterium uniforme]SKA61007.1 Methyltransferase domain-containing protein [Eubacterium uniforme]
MDTTKKFDGYADDYTQGRPSYAMELIDCFYEKFGLSKTSVIADIGSGTGKFSRHLLDRGNEVYSVEPNDDMRRVACDELGGYEKFHSVNGGAENTTLTNDSVDFITTAQAFHWFDVEKFRDECSRIIKNDGRVALIWNVRDESDPINKDLRNVYEKYCPNFKGFAGGIVKDDQRIKDFFNNQYDYVSFSNSLFYDKDKFIARSLSGSYSIKEGDEGYEEYMKEIIEIFDKYSDGKIVKIDNDSVAYIGCVK